MNKNVPILIGCFSIAVMLMLSVSVPIQFSDARYRDARYGERVIQDLVNDCDEASCENIGVIGDDGRANSSCQVYSFFVYLGLL
jgi:hypothetical protein